MRRNKDTKDSVQETQSPSGAPQPQSPARCRGRRGRLFTVEKIVLAVGYATILYWLVRGAVYLAVWIGVLMNQ